jgi:hypothetical protein
MNRLASEPSPYLRQHAENPVDWYPWGADAFETSLREDKPILLSVGYSACHWCHVMAHESFEDPVTASLMNASFVCIKVDREERPDVDSIYMEAVQAISGRGGWPMTVFLTPDGRPFYAGTYFPDRDAHGMPSFRRVLEAISDTWTNRREDVETQANELSESIRQRAGLADQLVGAVKGGIDWPLTAHSLLGQAVGEISSRFDERYGGIGPAPKFPQTSLIELCLRNHKTEVTEEDSLHVATRTLDAMAAGGIYDHFGGGFSRYSTDVTWTVPHFEKMLYDQAALVIAYTHAWQVTKQERYMQVLEETIAYVIRDLSAPGVAGLCAAEDADSEGVEGLFYTWTPEEIDEVLPEELAKVAKDWYGITAKGNFEGRCIPRRDLGAELIRPPEVEMARQLLFDARATRVRPGRDDKVLTEWNAMFASALAQAASATGRDDWAKHATEIGEFLLSAPRRTDGRFMRSWQDGVNRYLAYAADYAWVVDCFTRLGELTGRAKWFDEATKVAGEMIRLFGDEKTGALFSTGNDAEPILVRPVDLLDDATPSAASVAASALIRLGTLTGAEDLVGQGEVILALLLPIAAQHPLAVANAIGAMSGAGGGTVEVVVTGERPDLLRTAQERYEPDAVILWGERTSSPLWQERPDGSAYVCRFTVCQLPALSSDELSAQLDSQTISLAKSTDEKADAASTPRAD